MCPLWRTALRRSLLPLTGRTAIERLSRYCWNESPTSVPGVLRAILTESALDCIILVPNPAPGSSVDVSWPRPSSRTRTVTPSGVGRTSTPTSPRPPEYACRTTFDAASFPARTTSVPASGFSTGCPRRNWRTCASDAGVAGRRNIVIRLSIPASRAAIPTDHAKSDLPVLVAPGMPIRWTTGRRR